MGKLFRDKYFSCYYIPTQSTSSLHNFLTIMTLSTSPHLRSYKPAGFIIANCCPLLGFDSTSVLHRFFLNVLISPDVLPQNFTPLNLILSKIRPHQPSTHTRQRVTSISVHHVYHESMSFNSPLHRLQYSICRGYHDEKEVLLHATLPPPLSKYENILYHVIHPHIY